MWTDEQLLDALANPRLFGGDRERLDAAVGQAAKRGLVGAVQPKGLGEWREQGWFVLMGPGPGQTLGLYRSRGAAELAKGRLVSMFEAGKGQGPMSLHHLRRHVVRLVYEGQGNEYDPSMDPLIELDSNLETHPFYAPKRRRIADKAFSVVPLPQGFSTDPSNEATGGVPTRDDEMVARHTIISNDKARRQAEGEGQTRAKEFKEFLEAELETELETARARQQRISEGLDPSKMSDDGIPLSRRAVEHPHRISPGQAAIRNLKELALSFGMPRQLWLPDQIYVWMAVNVPEHEPLARSLAIEAGDQDRHLRGALRGARWHHGVFGRWPWEATDAEIRSLYEDLPRRKWHEWLCDDRAAGRPPISKRADAAFGTACPHCYADISALEPERTSAGLYRMMTCPECKGHFYPQEAALSRRTRQREPLAIGKWPERGWWGIWWFDSILGIADSEAHANEIMRVMADDFAKRGPSLLTQEEWLRAAGAHAGVVAALGLRDSPLVPSDYVGEGERATEVFASHPLYEKRRRELAATALRAKRLPPGPAPGDNAIVRGNRPTDSNGVAADNHTHRVMYDPYDGEPFWGAHPGTRPDDADTRGPKARQKLLETLVPPLRRRFQGFDPSKMSDDGIPLSRRAATGRPPISKRAQDPVRRTAESILKIINFILFRVPQKNKLRYIQRIRGKIMRIPAGQVSMKRLPQTAAIGQAISLTKNILSGLNPFFVKRVVDELSNLMTLQTPMRKPLELYRSRT
jgi:hypothetical protein